MNTCISNKNFLEADLTLTRINQLKKIIINRESSSKKRIYKQQHNVIKRNKLIQTEKFNKEWDETYKQIENIFNSEKKQLLLKHEQEHKQQLKDFEDKNRKEPLINHEVIHLKNLLAKAIKAKK